MSEWLDAGQLLSTIKGNEIYEMDDQFHYVTLKGDLIYCDEYGERDNHKGDNGIVMMNMWFMTSKFKRIIKNVTLADAMIALKNGGTIVQHFDNKASWKYTYEDGYIITWYKNHKKNEWELWEECNGKGALCGLEGKWTIEK